MILSQLYLALDRVYKLAVSLPDVPVDDGSFCIVLSRRAVSGMDRARVVTLVGQRVFMIALGYEDLNDHDELRHDAMMAVLAGKLEARRADCAPVAGLPRV